MKGVGWSAADAFLGQGVTFLVGIVLARLLSPAEYGLIGICMIFTTVLSGIVDSGLSNSLIRKKVVTDDDYNTMFITNMLMSIVLFVLLYITAPLIASFFSREELIVLIRVMGLILFFQALSLVQYTRLTKRIDFKTKTKASIIAAIVSGGIGIGMAYAGFGVWSLVGQKLSERLIYTLCLWVFNWWFPRCRFCLDSFHYMWGFGWKIMLAGLLNNIWKELYQVVVGKFYSPATLGQYTRARQFSHLFSTNLTNIIQRVTFPVLSNIQDDRERLLSVYRRIIKMTMLVTASGMFFLGAISEPLLYCLIGPKWHDATAYLPLICITGSLYPLHAINLNMLQVQGRSDLFLGIEVVKKILSLGPLFIGVFIGIIPMLCTSVVIGVVAYFINSYYSGKLINYSSWMQIKDVAPFYGIALLIVLSVFFLKYLPLPTWTILLVQLVIGFSSFLFICITMHIREFKELTLMIKNYYHHIRLRHR